MREQILAGGGVGGGRWEGEGGDLSVRRLQTYSGVTRTAAPALHPAAPRTEPQKAAQLWGSRQQAAASAWTSHCLLQASDTAVTAAVSSAVSCRSALEPPSRPSRPQRWARLHRLASVRLSLHWLCYHETVGGAKAAKRDNIIMNIFYFAIQVRPLA